VQSSAPAATPAQAQAQAPSRPNNRATLKANKELAAAKARIAELEPLATSAGNATKIMAAHASRELEALSENARKSILARHPKDPFKQMEAIEFLRESGALASGAPTGASTGHSPAGPSAGSRDGSDPDAAWFKQIESGLASDSARTRMRANALIAANPTRYESARKRLSSNAAN
jgi:hypothetical protein